MEVYQTIGFINNKTDKMKERLFKIGDVITKKDYCTGFESVPIIKIDDKFYHCRIPNGVVILTHKIVEENYVKVEENGTRESVQETAD